MAYFSHSACTAHGTPPIMRIRCTICCLWTNLANIDGLVDWLVRAVGTRNFWDWELGIGHPLWSDSKRETIRNAKQSEMQNKTNCSPCRSGNPVRQGGSVGKPIRVGRMWGYGRGALTNDAHAVPQEKRGALCRFLVKGQIKKDTQKRSTRWCAHKSSVVQQCASSTDTHTHYHTNTRIAASLRTNLCWLATSPWGMGQQWGFFASHHGSDALLQNHNNRRVRSPTTPCTFSRP